MAANRSVVNSAPPVEILERAALWITHARFDPVLLALAQGVRLVAIPVAYDQPGMAVRIRCLSTALRPS